MEIVLSGAKQKVIFLIKSQSLKTDINCHLSDLSPGESALIEDFEDDCFSSNLLEMGFLPGEKVIFHRYAPLGDPLLVELSGYFLTLRKADAKMIRISKPDL